MGKMRILVIGGSGLLGSKLVEMLNNKSEYSVSATYHQNNNNCNDNNDFNEINEVCDFYRVDITKEDDVSSVFEKVNPDIVIHTAAYTDVDGCEKNKEKAFNVNVKGTGHIAKYADERNAKLVYVSTDYVFNGKQGNYKEEDKVDPVGYYGETKLLGEQRVTEICSDYLICRTSVIYGTGKNNFAVWLTDRLANNKPVRIVDDQFVSCTYNMDLSEQIIALIKQDNKQGMGIYHTAGAERISRYDFSLRLADIFAFDTNLITAVKMKDFDWFADRPADSSLDISKISKIKEPYGVNKALTLFKKEYDQNQKRMETLGEIKI